jgi:hypothetical protein
LLAETSRQNRVNLCKSVSEKIREICLPCVAQRAKKGVNPRQRNSVASVAEKIREIRVNPCLNKKTAQSAKSASKNLPA